MTTDQIEQSLGAILNDIFDRDIGSLKEAESFFDLKGWDSLSQAQLVAAIESEFDIYFTPEESMKLANVRECMDLISAKLPKP